MNKAEIYARSSMKAMWPIEAQVITLAGYCRDKELEIIECILDQGSFGARVDTAVKKACALKGCALVACSEDRLTRSPRLMKLLTDELAESGSRLIVIDNKQQCRNAQDMTLTDLFSPFDARLIGYDVKISEQGIEVDNQILIADDRTSFTIQDRLNNNPIAHVSKLLSTHDEVTRIVATVCRSFLTENGV